MLTRSRSRDLHDPTRAITVSLAHDRYKKLIVEVADPAAAVQAIRAALARGSSSPYARGVRALVPLVLALALGPSCASAAADLGPATHVRFSLGHTPPRFGEVPFPSDLHRDAAGVLAIEGFEVLVGAHTDALRDGLATLDGFGRTTAVHMFLDGDVDPNTLAGAALLLDIDPRSETRGRKIKVLSRFIPALRSVSLLPMPGEVLAPGTRYAAFLGNKARTPLGRPLEPDADLKALSQRAAPDRKTPADALYGPALDAAALARVEDDLGPIVGLAVYTTSRAVFELPALRDRLQDPAVPAPHLFLDAAGAGPYPVAMFGRTSTPSLDEWLGHPAKDATGLDLPGNDDPAGVAHDALDAVASGAFEAPSFLDPTAHRFVRDGSSFKLVDAKALVPITLAVPSTPEPPAGYPVVIVSHGLGSTRSTVLAVANEYARAGFATVGIDDVQHGSRAGTGDLGNEFPGSYRGPDGIPDRDTVAGLSFFAGFTDLPAMRDNFRQTVLDHVSIVRLIRSASLDLSPLGKVMGRTPKLDARWIFWMGGSFGGINGSTTAAVEPSIAAFALQVPGGGWAHLLIPHSPQMSPVVTSLVRTTYKIEDGDTPLDSFHPLNNLVAQVVEAGDPLAYAPHVGRAPFSFGGAPRAAPANVLLTFALDDEVLPNLATSALVRAMGLTLVGPSQRPFEGVPRADGPFAATGVLAAVEYAPASHGLGYGRTGDRTYLPSAKMLDALESPELLPRPFKFAMPLREHLAQQIQFFRSTMAGRPEVILTAPSRADADGDGVLDDAERKAGTDPYDPKSH